MTEAMMNIPDKLTFKRTEVIKLTKLEGKVLDFWQKEFGVFAPIVNKTGDQFYTRHDVELIFKIKQWLIAEKIDKTKIKEWLKEEQWNPGELGEKPNGNGDFGKRVPNFPPDKIKIIKLQLQDILTILEKHDKN